MPDITVKHFMISVNDSSYLFILRKLFPEPYHTNFVKVIEEARQNPGKEVVASKAIGVHVCLQFIKDKKYFVFHLRPLGNATFTLYDASLYASTVRVEGFREAGFAAELIGGDPKRRSKLEAKIRKDPHWGQTIPEAQKGI